MSATLHFRRCHVCGTLNEKQDERVKKCDHCGKPFAPFYFFNEKLTATASESNLRPPLLDGEYFPIQGVTVMWDDE